MTTTHDLRNFTRLFPTFLGLRLVPLGLWFLAASVPGIGPFTSTAHGALMAVVIAATWGIHRWYRRHYGSVEPTRLGFGRNWALLGGLAAAILALGLGSSAIALRPSVIAAAVIVFLAAALFALPRHLSGDLVVTGLFLGAAALAALLMVSLTREPSNLGILGALLRLSLGILLCLAGAAEHLLLARGLARLESGGDV